MGNLFKDLLKDKTDRYSLREVIIAVCMLLIVISWVAQLVFNIPTPEFMFYSMVSLVAAGCFGYSIERKPPTK
jgi:archaellum biogenesis protein FlaJ (TadC family)